MIRYLAGRFLLAIPTLFGITFLTFGLMHLAPGEGVPDGQTVRPDDVKTLRRQYFFDLPLFLNFNVEDRRHAIADQIRQLHDPRKRLTYQERLGKRGTIAVPYLWRARDVPGVDEVLRDICLEHAPLCPGGDLAALQRASEHPQTSAGYGSAAVPFLMERVEHGAEPERSRALAQLAAIVGAQRDWWEWWFVHEREFREFDRWERSVGLLAETQYAKWLRRIANWKLGYSTRGGRPVEDMIAESFPVTFRLAVFALVLAFALGIPLGVWSATRRGSCADQAVTVLLFVLFSLPSFWVAAMLILLFGQAFDFLPIYGLCPLDARELAGLDHALACAPHYVMPVACLTYGSLAVVSRYQRTGMLEILGQDFVRTARAKGLAERAVVLRHALRNAAIPVVTVLGLYVPALLGGSVIVERAFTIPGMGGLAFDSINGHDSPVVMGITLVAALITMASSLLVDVLYTIVDPRIRYQGQ